MSRQKNGYTPDRKRNANGTFAYCEELQPRQRAMIYELIANGGHKTAACDKLGIPRSTLYDWLNDDKFMTAYRKVSDKIHEECLVDIKRELVKLAKCDDKRTALKAIEDILKLNGYLDTKSETTEKPTEIKITLADTNE